MLQKRTVWKVFKEIKNRLENIDICFFYWTWIKKRKVYKYRGNGESIQSYFGTVNCIKAVEEYFIEKQNGTITIYHQ